MSAKNERDFDRIRDRELTKYLDKKYGDDDDLVQMAEWMDIPQPDFIDTEIVLPNLEEFGK